MNRRQFILFAISAVVLLAGTVSDVSAQFRNVTATSAEIRKTEKLPIGGELYATIDGKEQKISDSALEFWLINDGKAIVYSDTDGAGGYENEGQSLKLYDVQYNYTRKILSQYFMIAAVAEKKLSNGLRVLLVRMEDGGLGGSYLSVVDPERGEVFFRRWGELTKITGDTINLSVFTVGVWEDINQKRDGQTLTKTDVLLKPTSVKPTKIERYDLKMLLKKEVIYNPRDTLSEDPPDPKKVVSVKVYFWRANDEFENRAFVLSPVTRVVEKTSPLRGALEELFKEPIKDETDYGFSSATFGMKFEGVAIKNGTATVKFSQPPGQTNYGSLGPGIFAEAIHKTAKQFPNVRRVEICAVGETMIDSELEEQFPRCK